MTELRFIDREDFRGQLQEIAKRTIDPTAGLFGPESVTWEILRHTLGFLGGGRAVLLQLAHPWIANAIDQHSKTKDDPVGRFNRTFVNVFTMIFGSLDQALRCSQSVHDIHAKMSGQIAEKSGAFDKGSYYQANEVSAMLWVHATLWETAIAMHEAVYGPMPMAKKDQFNQEMKLFAFCFGIPEAALPNSWNEFMDYNRSMWESDFLKVESKGREIASFIFTADIFPGSRPLLRWLEIMTSEMMPTRRLADEFGLPQQTESTIKTYERSMKMIRAVYPRLPDRIKYVPMYYEALGRIQGKEHGDIGTKLYNRLLIGQAELVTRAV